MTNNLCPGCSPRPTPYVFEDDKRYNVVRFYLNDNHPRETVARGLTEESAQDWCHDPETSSSTCTHKRGIERTETFGPWFEGYEEA